MYCEVRFGLDLLWIGALQFDVCRDQSVLSWFDALPNISIRSSLYLCPCIYLYNALASHLYQSMFLSLSIQLDRSLSIHLSLSFSLLHLFLYQTLFTHLSISLYIYLFFYIFIYPFILPFVHTLYPKL